MRLILAKKIQNDELKHIAGAFEVLQDKCSIETNEELDAGSYYAYVEMDKLTDKDMFSVLVMAIEIESMQEVNHDECPDFVLNWAKDYARSHPELYETSEKDPDYKYWDYLDDEIGGYKLLYFQNYSKTGNIVYQNLKYTKAEGYEFVSEQLKLNEDINYRIDPGFDHILYFEKIKIQCSSCYYSPNQVIYSDEDLLKKALDEDK